VKLHVLIGIIHLEALLHIALLSFSISGKQRLDFLSCTVTECIVDGMDVRLSIPAPSVPKKKQVTLEITNALMD
jgi:hypothetical protein